MKSSFVGKTIFCPTSKPTNKLFISKMNVLAHHNFWFGDSLPILVI
jgi:hypothetical protein